MLINVEFKNLDTKKAKGKLKSAIYNFLTKNGVQSNDDFFVDEFSFSSEDAFKIIKNYDFGAKTVSFPDLGEVNSIFSDCSDINDLFDGIKMFEEITTSKPKLTHVYLRPYELGSVNFAELFNTIRENELENAFKFAKLRQKVNNVLTHNNQYSIDQFKVF
ncbi:hypothetical protein MHBO_001456 [Bonamia ostreae]|uniref:Uncharacterized protein n=1 Tax=Bonamia ostreae TaxID=126728 RepID=A0ABV2AJ25_9EUKA